MIPIVIVSVLAAAALIYVAAPLRTRRENGVDETDFVVQEAAARTQTALGALMDLDEDRESGRLTDPDYRSLRQRYEVEAVDALRKADALRRDGSEDEVEGEIERIKRRLRCPSCGAPRPPGERCSKCGA